VEWAKFFAGIGYVAFVAEFKLTVGDFTAEEQRIAAQNFWKLLKFIRDNDTVYKIKKRDGFIAGISAGGITAAHANIGLTERTDPYFDQFDFYSENLKIRASASAPGAVADDFKAFIKKDNLMAPHIFIHGVQDPTLPYSEAQEAWNLMKDAGVYDSMVPLGYTAEDCFTSFKTAGHKVAGLDVLQKDGSSLSVKEHLAKIFAAILGPAIAKPVTVPDFSL
jgi:hypothetical protein